MKSRFVCSLSYERALQDRRRRDPVRDVDDLRLGAMRFITPWHVPTKSSFKPKSLRNVMNTPRRVTPSARTSYCAASVRAEQRRAVARCVSPQRRGRAA
jgi:hypothetical protein